MKIRLLLGLMLVLLLAIPQISPVLAEESTGEKWVLEYTNSPDSSDEFRRDLDNDVGYELGSLDLDAGSVTYNYHKEKDGTVLHDYVIETVFNKPPEELIPGQTIELNFFNRVLSNSRDIDVGARYYYSVADSNLGEIARADISRLVPSATLTIQVPQTNDGELVIFFGHQFFHDLTVDWRYRAGEEKIVTPEPEVTADVSETSEDEEFSESDFDDLTEETLPQFLNSDPYASRMVVKPWGSDTADWVESKLPSFLQGWVKNPNTNDKTTVKRGRIDPGQAEVYVYHKAFKKWVGPLKSEVPVYTGDIVVTTGGKNAIVTFFNDHLGEGGHSTDSIPISGDTVLQVPFTPEDYAEKEEYLLWSLYKGAVRVKRAAFKETNLLEERDPFIVRTPTVVCGSGEGRRPHFGSSPENTLPVAVASLVPDLGNILSSSASVNEDWTDTSDFIIQYDPETESTSIYVISGEVDYYNLIMGGEDTSVLTAGESLFLSERGNEYVEPLSQEQWDALVDENKLGNITYPDEADMAEYFGEDSSDDQTSGSSSSTVIFVIIGIVVLGALAFSIYKFRTKPQS
ncbi:hypothetical protein ACFLYQ_00310 [Chloroflexota bacterium]